MFSLYIKIFLLINLILVPAFLAEKANVENKLVDVSVLNNDNREQFRILSKRRRRGTFWKAVGAGALIGGGAALLSKAFKG
uniref:Candidate secreted effector n=1 Tax=Meloidogyne incognita TaxID=6306 RepID=A0A914NQU7_MELIC